MPMLCDPGLSRRPPLVLAPGLALAVGRAHEVAGPARHLFALRAAAAAAGPVLWIRPLWAVEDLAGDGIAAHFEPARLVICRCRTHTDSLWAAEEALRSGTVPLVVVELAAPPALTPVRRLHLAAEAGAAAAASDGAAGGAAAPLALLLTPDEGGAPGVETRWHLAPVPGWATGGPARWRLRRLRARAAPPAAWTMRLGRGGFESEPDAAAGAGGPAATGR